MAVGDELRDPWGWLVAGVSAGLGWAVLATPMGPAAAVVGASIGAAGLGTKVLVGTARGRAAQSSPDTAVADRLPKPPRGSPQAALAIRAQSAVDRIGALAESPGDRWVAEEVSSVLKDSRTVLGMVAELAGRVTLL